MTRRDRDEVMPGPRGLSGPPRPAGGTARRALVLAFVSLGAASSTVPAAVPGAAERLGVHADELLPSVSLLFAGLLVGVLLAAIPRSRQRRVLVTGLALESIGLVLVACSTTTAMFLAASVVTGLGFGLTEASATALARSSAASGTSVRLTALNGATAVAAAAAPALIALVPVTAAWIPIMAFAIVPACGAVVVSTMRTGWAPQEVGTDRPAQNTRTRRGSLFIVGAALFVFVGAETILAGWSGVLAQSVFDLSSAFAASGTALFWILMAVGRFVCSWVVRRGAPPAAYLVAALGLAAAVIVLAATLPDSALTGLLLGVTVLLVAPGYALLLGAALESIPASMAARTTAWLVAVGSAGGSVVAFVVAATVGADPVPVLLSVGGLLAVCALLAALFGRRTLR